MINHVYSFLFEIDFWSILFYSYRYLKQSMTRKIARIFIVAEWILLSIQCLLSPFVHADQEEVSWHTQFAEYLNLHLNENSRGWFSSEFDIHGREYLAADGSLLLDNTIQLWSQYEVDALSTVTFNPEGYTGELGTIVLSPSYKFYSSDLLIIPAGTYWSENTNLKLDHTPYKYYSSDIHDTWKRQEFDLRTLHGVFDSKWSEGNYALTDFKLSGLGFLSDIDIPVKTASGRGGRKGSKTNSTQRRRAFTASGSKFPSVSLRSTSGATAAGDGRPPQKPSGGPQKQKTEPDSQEAIEKLKDYIKKFADLVQRRQEGSINKESLRTARRLMEGLSKSNRGIIEGMKEYSSIQHLFENKPK